VTTKSPAQLSDDELWQFCRAESERASRHAYGGCVVTLGIVIAAFVAAMYALPDLLPESVFIGPFIALGLALVVYFSLLSRLARYRHPDAFQEWKKRETRKLFGDEPAGPRAAARLFDAPEPPDWILLFTGAGLPHGKTVWTNVYLKAAPPSGTLAAGSAPHVDFFAKENPLAEISNTRGVLGQADAEAVLALLTPASLTELKSMPPNVVDGFPCSVTILRREPRLTHMVTANLAGKVPETNPTIRLLRLLANLKA
jgi:hypothetical protein